MEHEPVMTPFGTPVSGPKVRAMRGATAFAAGHAAIVPAVFPSGPQRDNAARRPGAGYLAMRASAGASGALTAVLWGWLLVNAQAAPVPGAQPEVLTLKAPLPGATTAAETSVSPAAFLIEKIVVEGVGHGAEKIVSAETLLRLGSSYTEAQLREALQRVERLPFVVQADFSLRRGTERGNFELVITVTETKPIFFGGSFDVHRNVRRYGHDWIFEVGGPLLGARVFFGGQSELSAGLTGGGYSGSEGSSALFNVAYTHHNLFGRHVAGSVFLGVPEIGTQLALPLNRANVLTLDIRRSRSRSESSGPGYYESEHRSTTSRVGLTWQRDTTDNPFTPRRGTHTGARVGYSTDDYRQNSPWGFGPPQGPTPEPTLRIGREAGLSGSLYGSHYWSLPGRLSLGLEANLSGSQGEFRGTATRGDVVESDDGDRWSMNGLVKARLIGTIPGRPGGTTHQWWEVAASLSGSRFRTEWDPPGTYRSYDGRSTSGLLSVSAASRGRWGTVVLSLQYQHQYRSRYDWR